MINHSRPPLSSRKQPKQARSAELVSTILEAAVQVLRKEGAQRFTTARVRRLGPFVGATVMKSSVTLEDRSGRRVFQGKVGGAKRMKGESLEVTNSLAKRVRKALEKTPDLQSNKPGGK